VVALAVSVTSQRYPKVAAARKVVASRVLVEHFDPEELYEAMVRERA